jgi:hypothetical protein
MTRKPIDLAAFAPLWHAGETLDNLASRFGVSRATVIRFAAKNGLPHRGQPCVCGGHGDPTPEQIAERARECRERHYAMRRAERTPLV